MQKLREIMSSTAAVAVTLMFATAVPVYAEGTGNAAQTPAEAHAAVQSDRAQLTADKQQVTNDKAQLVADKTTAKANADANKQKVCDLRKTGLEHKFSNMVSNSSRVETKIDKVFAEAQQYATTNGVTPSDSTLLTKAQDAQAAAQQAVQSLKDGVPTLDCTNPSAASTVKGFKTQAAATRDALKAYRQAVIAYIQGLEQAKPGAASVNSAHGSSTVHSTTTPTQTNSTTTNNTSVGGQ